MKNNGKTEAKKDNIGESTWNFEIEWPEIDFDWNTDENLLDTKKKSEDNVRGGSRIIVRET